MATLLNEEASSLQQEHGEGVEQSKYSTPIKYFVNLLTEIVAQIVPVINSNIKIRKRKNPLPTTPSLKDLVTEPDDNFATIKSLLKILFELANDGLSSIFNF